MCVLIPPNKEPAREPCGIRAGSNSDWIFLSSAKHIFRHVHANGNVLCRRVDRKKLVLRATGQLFELGARSFQSLNKTLPDDTAVRKLLENIVFEFHCEHPFPSDTADRNQFFGSGYRTTGLRPRP